MRITRYIRPIAAAAALAIAPLALPATAPAAAETPPVKLWDGFRSPVGMAFDASGNLYIAEWSAGQISRISPQGARSVFAEGLSGPSGLTIDAAGTIYAASYQRDEIYRFTPDGARSVHVGGLATPAGISFDRTGRMLIANRRTDQILRVTPDGRTEPIIGGLQTPVGVVQTPDDGYVVSNINGGVTIVRPDGARVEAGEDFGAPGPGIAVTGNGRVFVVDYGGTTIREILSDGTSRVVADGLGSPVGLVVAPDSRSLFTATWGDGAVYRVPIPK